jgi:pimeloyl-ACP methyl ester carboxylesterase
MKAYFISGLAAGSSVFRNITLPAGYETVYLDWIPHQKNESLPHYAMRMAERIETGEPFVLIGLSFGGFLVTEIAKRYKPAVTILISSVPLSSNIPRYYKLAGMLRLHKILPAFLVKFQPIARHFFNIKTGKDKEMLADTIRTIDIPFTRWGIDAILKWKNKEIPQPFWHIHGTADRLLPVKNTQPTHTLIGSGHMMVVSNGNEISSILKEILVI